MRSLRDYTVVTSAYWTLTLTDSALRVMILLFLHEQGRDALEIASLFLFYEFFGVVTNLAGGIIGTRFGLKVTLFAGLSLQIAACSLLLGEAAELGLYWLMTSQALAGIAKDLTKMSSKSYIKLVVPRGDESALMKWVSILTGSKNALKGVGFFLGGLLLSTVGFRNGAVLMILMLATALLVATALLPSAPGRSSRKLERVRLFSRDARLNWLAACRLFLFASRDAWFVLALPLFLGSRLGWSFWEVGGFLAFWVIFYGLIQAAAPRFVGRPAAGKPASGRLGLWTALLVLPLLVVVRSASPDDAATWILMAGLIVFAVIFAANSAIHSYLVVSFSDEDEVAMRVGFYYAANALGRFLGTWISGGLYARAGEPRLGLAWTLEAAIVLALASFGFSLLLRRAELRALRA